MNLILVVGHHATVKFFHFQRRIEGAKIVRKAGVLSAAAATFGPIIPASTLRLK
jgi:hypothetical protein